MLDAAGPVALGGTAHRHAGGHLGQVERLAEGLGRRGRLSAQVRRQRASPKQ
ncbi:hypothetical protein ACGF0J_29420 [Nonomuraea sp. NPDC047897]|uniref:hypothetical protein n=1 Tax=Nonomuraea sp. NPDC047897 TaxID=3364346 RepID=UPI00371C59B1